MNASTLPRLLAAALLATSLGTPLAQTITDNGVIASITGALPARP